MNVTAILVTVLLALAGALHSAEPQTFEVRGVVRELRRDKSELVIKHEAIPGYMDAMVMPFTVRDARLFDQVAPDDSISFKLKVTDKADWIEKIKVIARGRPIATPKKPDAVLKKGTKLPLKEIELTDESGRPFNLAGNSDRAVALTFFFTRCPFPKMCPLLSSKFAEAQKLLAADPITPKNPLLVSITIDPERDTPDVLRRYAKMQKADPALWCFATGKLESVTKLAFLCGTDFWEDNGLINHSLRTLIFDSDGRVQRVFTDNDWTPEELVSELRHASKAKRESF